MPPLALPLVVLLLLPLAVPLPPLALPPPLHAAAPAALVCGAVQGTQALEPDLPVLGLAWLAGHCWGAVAPAMQKAPVGHSRHSPAAGA